jgi:predicted DCC family thiol-disulfide oxidoreductase YuxK
MATAVNTSEKFLAYDGDCPMCTSLIGWLLRTRLVSPEQARANHDLHGDDLDAVRAAGIRNQLVVLDPLTRQTRAGSDGLLWIIGENLGRPWWIRALGLPGMRQIVSFTYEAVSYNRRIISPPRHQIVCDCEPEVTVARRLMLIVPTTLKALLGFALLGMAVRVGQPLNDVLRGGWTTLAVVACGWAMLTVTALALLKGERRIDYIGHLGISLLAGALITLPCSVIVALLPDTAAIVGASLTLLIAYVVMLRMQPRRHKALGLGGGWRWAWAAVMAATFLAVANTQGLFGLF